MRVTLIDELIWKSFEISPRNLLDSFSSVPLGFSLMFSVILHGRKSLELQKWRDFRVTVNIFQNANAFSNSFSSASGAADVSSRDGRKGQNFTVSSYLVESLGLTRKHAESISRKVSFEEKVNPDSVVSLLRSHGFTDSQISSIVTTYPGLLVADANKSIGPKLQFLKSRGGSTSELTEILTKAPKILVIKKNKAISRYYDFVKEIVEADKSSKFEKLCLSSLSQGGMHENKLRNVSVLRELGVPQKSLLSLLTSDHHVCCGKENFEESLKKVLEMGFDPTTSKFVRALRMLYQLSDKTVEEKVNFYKSLGFAVGDVWEIFKKNPGFLALSEKNVLNSIEAFVGLGFSRDEVAMLVKSQPQCLNYSAETVKKKTEFLVKEMNWPLKSVLSTPQVLGYNLEKRTAPRCKVIKALMSKGLLGSELPSIGYVLICTDKVFLERYVMKHDDDTKLVAKLMAIFAGDS